MVVLDERQFRIELPSFTEVDERDARRTLRGQIAKLEQELAECVVSAFPTQTLDIAVPAAGGPRMLSLGDLERVRDDLALRVGDARSELAARGEVHEANRLLLEKMLANPGRYKFVKVPRSDLGVGGCGAYEVRPRFGIVGMCMGWWHIKLSSGCPLATARRLGAPGIVLRARSARSAVPFVRPGQARRSARRSAP